MSEAIAEKTPPPASAVFTPNARLYDVLDADSHLKLSLKGPDGVPIILDHLFRRGPNWEADLIKLSKDIVRRTESLTKGRERFQYEEDVAYDEHFKTIIAGATIIDGEKRTDLTEEQIAELPFEQNAEAVRRLYLSTIEVVPEAAGSGYDWLFDKAIPVIAIQKIGDPDQPSFVLRHRITQPEKGERSNYRRNASHMDTLRSGDKPIRSFEVDITAGIKLFKQRFLSASGVRLGEREFADDKSMATFTADDQAAFFANFNPLWMADIMSAVVNRLNANIQD